MASMAEPPGLPAPAAPGERVGISRHAIARFRERVADLPEAEADALLRDLALRNWPRRRWQALRGGELRVWWGERPLRLVLDGNVVATVVAEPAREHRPGRGRGARARCWAGDDQRPASRRSVPDPVPPAGSPCLSGR